jgi:hypothetical protein
LGEKRKRRKEEEERSHNVLYAEHLSTF